MTTRIFIVTCITILATSIGFSKKKATPISLKLPKSTLMVLNFNFDNINSKIDLAAIKELDFMQFGFENFRKSQGEDSTIIQRLYENPLTYGINLESEVTIGVKEYLTVEEEKSFTPYIVFNLAKVKKFEKLMQSFYNEGTEYEDFLETRNVFKIYKTYDKAFVWNLTTLYIIPTNYENRNIIDVEIAEITDLRPLTSLDMNASFSNVKMKTDDIHFWLDYDKFITLTEENMTKLNSKSIFNTNLERIKGTETDFGMNFNNGQISFETKTKVNQTLKKENAAIYSKKVNPVFFDYVHSDSLMGLFSMAFNINELKSSLEKNYKNLIDTLEKTVEHEIAEDNIDSNQVILDLRRQLENDTISFQTQMQIYDAIDIAKDSLIAVEMKDANRKVDSTLNEYGMTREDAWNLFEGDFMIASTGTYQVIDTITTIEYSEDEDGEYGYNPITKTVESPRPLFLSMATINLTEKCKIALEKLESEGVIKQENDYFYVSVTKYDFYIKLANNVLILTNDKNIVSKQHVKGKNIFGHKANKDVIKKTITSPFYTFVDINKVLTKASISSGETKMMQPAIDAFSTFEIISKLLSSKDLKANTTINFNQEDENSIHILFNMANEYYKLMMGNAQH